MRRKLFGVIGAAVIVAFLCTVLLNACSQAPVASQYAGIVFGYVDGKLALAKVAGIAASKAECDEAMQKVKSAVEASAPPGGSVAVECVPLPNAPVPVAPKQNSQNSDDGSYRPSSST